MRTVTYYSEQDGRIKYYIFCNVSSKVSAATCGALSTLIREDTDTPPIAEEDGEHNGSEHLVIALGGQLSGVCCIIFSSI